MQQELEAKLPQAQVEAAEEFSGLGAEGTALVVLTSNEELKVLG